MTDRRGLKRWDDSSARILLLGVGLSVALLIVLLVLLQENDALSSLPWVASTTLLLATTLILSVLERRSFLELREEMEQTEEFIAALSARGEAEELMREDLWSPEVGRLVDAVITLKRNAEADITKMKRLEKVRNEFLGNVSHELRTPIFTVQGFLETLLDGAIDDPEVRDEFLQKAHLNVLRLHSLLNDLIEISRIESGEMKMSMRYFDIVDLARGTIRTLTEKSALHNVKLVLEQEGSAVPLEVYADRKRIEQVLINLLDNGIKYSGPNGSVRLALQRKGKTVVVTVADDGPGIPESDQPRIFERFYRVDKGRSRDVGGSGLGLSIVKHIIEAHGTDIHVDSDGINGTTFSFPLSR